MVAAGGRWVQTCCWHENGIVCELFSPRGPVSLNSHSLQVCSWAGKRTRSVACCAVWSSGSVGYVAVAAGKSCGAALGVFGVVWASKGEAGGLVVEYLSPPTLRHLWDA